MVGSLIPRVGNMRMVGRVVSDKMQRTVVVRVDHKVWHSKYRRFFVRRKRFFAHDHGLSPDSCTIFLQILNIHKALHCHRDSSLNVVLIFILSFFQMKNALPEISLQLNSACVFPDTKHLKLRKSWNPSTLPSLHRFLLQLQSTFQQSLSLSRNPNNPNQPLSNSNAHTIDCRTFIYNSHHITKTQSVPVCRILPTSKVNLPPFLWNASNALRKPSP